MRTCYTRQMLSPACPALLFCFVFHACLQMISALVKLRTCFRPFACIFCLCITSNYYRQELLKAKVESADFLFLLLAVYFKMACFMYECLRVQVLKIEQNLVVNQSSASSTASDIEQAWGNSGKLTSVQ